MGRGIAPTTTGRITHSVRVLQTTDAASTHPNATPQLFGPYALSRQFSCPHRRVRIPRNTEHIGHLLDLASLQCPKCAFGA
jgi:hypothetical protein